MFELMQTYLWGDELFITSPVFFLMLVGPSLYLFIVSILRNLRNGGGSQHDVDKRVDKGSRH